MAADGGDYNLAADILPPEIVGPHLDDLFGSRPARESQRPAAESKDPLDEPAEEPEEEGSAENDEDKDEDDDGEDPGDDSDEDDDDDGDEDEEEEEEVLESVSAEELKRIENDPALSKIHKLMQRTFTQKTQAVSERAREVDTREERVQQFEDQLQTPTGMTGYLRDTFERQPHIAAAAFEQVAYGDGNDQSAALNFLLEVGLHSERSFETLQKALERVEELRGDEDEMRRHTRNRENTQREVNLDAREQRVAERTFDREFTSLVGAAEREIEEAGLHPDDVDDVRAKVVARVKERVKGNVGRDGKIKLTPADAKKIAEEEWTALAKQYAKAKQRLTREQVKTSREKVKEQARGAGRRQGSPPRAVGRRTPSEHKPFKAPAGRDGLDAFIDSRFAATH